MSDGIYRVKPTQDTPLFILDENTGHITIKGVSMPENAFEFYDPIEKTVLEHAHAVKGYLVLEIELLYMNSMSNKQILKLIKLLSAKEPALKVVWKYAGGDSLIKLKGEEIRSICNPIVVVVEQST